MTYFKADSETTLDLVSLAPLLPSKTSAGPDGRAVWLSSDHNIARLVIGGEKDYIVDFEGVQETGVYLDTTPVIVPDMYHDVMLGPRWRDTAEVLCRVIICIEINIEIYYI